VQAVLNIRQRRQAGERAALIARSYGVARATVERAVNGTCWRILR
jgi:hypothetical protein